MQDALAAQSEKQALDFWSVREGLPIEKLPNLLNFDVSLPIGLIGDYADACTAALRGRTRWLDTRFCIRVPSTA